MTKPPPEPTRRPSTVSLISRESETNGDFVVERNSFRSIAKSIPYVEIKRNGMNSVLRLRPKITQLELAPCHHTMRLAEGCENCSRHCY